MIISKPSKKLIALIMLVFIIFGLAFIIEYNNIIKKPLKSNEDKIIVEVKQGEGFYDILNKLSEEGKLSNKLLIKVKLSIDKRNINIQEGIYEIDSNVTLDELINSLENTADNKKMVKLTIPEGYSVEEIAKTVEEKGLCTKKEFLDAVKNYNMPDFVKKNSSKRYDLEGFLYPDTYFIVKNSDANYIVDIMMNRFKQVIKEAENETGVEVKDDDIEKIIIIASMIEKEARIDKDRSLISSVIYNRIEKDMKLQIDAAVIYALGYHVDTVLNRHLEIDSPYNVYKYKGLPIGPIANPGIESIKAAMVPAKTDYLYYILQKDGSHYFTNNYDDFLNKKKELGY